MMDGLRFDQVIKSLVRAGSRRRIVQAGLAVAVGLGVTRVGGDVAAKDKAKHCPQLCKKYFAGQPPERIAQCEELCAMDACGPGDIGRVCNTSATDETLICCPQDCFFWCGDAS